jgi:hypothetical protein
LKHNPGVPLSSEIGAGLARFVDGVSGPIAEGSETDRAVVTLAACSGRHRTAEHAAGATGPRGGARSLSASPCDLVNGEGVSMRVKGDQAASDGEQR